MLLLALRQLRLDPLRTALTGLVLGAAIGAILVFNGFEQGQYAQAARAVLDRGGDLIVMEAGASSFFDRSSLPQLSRAAVEAVPGVAAAHPLTRVPVIYQKDGIRTPISVFVTDDAGGPSRVVSGRSVRGERDVVIDESLAVKHGLRVGDPLVLSEFEFTVVGISRGSAAMFSPFAFISYDGMIDFFLESELASDISTFPMLSALLVELEPDAVPEVVARAIPARVSGVAALTPEQLAVRTVALAESIFGPVMGLLIAVGYVVALLVVALILHMEVGARLKSFAVLKALGFAPLRLHGAVLWQAALLLLIAFPVGAAVAAAAARVIGPDFEVLPFEPVPLAQAVVATLLLGGAGALASLRQVSRADPALAFQGS